MEESQFLKEILHDAKIGWWRVDTNLKTITLSDHLLRATTFEEPEIDIYRFFSLVSDSFRLSIKNILDADINYLPDEQLFSLTKSGEETWFNWKVIRREYIPNGQIIYGYAQELIKSEVASSDLYSIERMNTLLYRLNSISHTLLSLFHTENINKTITSVLTDILKMFQGSRAYIAEFDWENRMHIYTYEVTDKGVESGHDQVSRLPMDESPWWVEQLEKGNPIILTTLADLPPEAFRERLILEAQNIQSLFVLPLISHSKVWGYAGIDIVEQSRKWHNEDRQWFTSLVNIMNICIELQRSKSEVQTERDYLRDLYRFMPLGYLRLKILYNDQGKAVDYRILDSNLATEQIIEQPASAFTGKTATEMGIDPSEMLPSLLQTDRNEYFIEKNSPLFPTNKIVRTITYSTVPGEVICLLSDNTEIQETHEALDRSEKILRNIYDNIPAGLELYGKDGLLLDCNNKDLEIFGVDSKEKVLNLNIFSNPIIPPDVKERIKNREDFSFKLVYPFAHTEGYYRSNKMGYIEIYTSVNMLYDAQGELDKIMLMNIDNTEINKAHSRIAEFESSFLLVSQFGQVGYCRFDLISLEGYAQPQWYHNLGEREDTPLNQVIGVYRHIDPTHRAVFIANVQEMQEGKRNGFNCDLRVTANNKVKWTRINVIKNPFNNNPDKFEIVCVNYDITELKETEQSLIEAKNKAEVSDRLKSAFLANMSHEIRTPLNAIVGFSGLMAESNDAQERKEFANIVHENNELLLKLITDILDLSKIEAGTLEFNFTDFDAKTLCQDIVKSLNYNVQNRPILLQIENNLPHYLVNSDKIRLTQVLTNFINNALKFTQWGAVTVGYRMLENSSLEFYVHDTGMGISEEEQKSVFNRFVKLDGFAQGTGLGLAICKSIIEQLGGTIGVRSEKGKGSCFWFSLPTTTTQLSPLEKVETDEEIESEDSNKQMVLVVEDLDSNYEFLLAILKNDYSVIRAKNGIEALEMCRKFVPDLIIMDIMMPLMDGLEATRRLRKANFTMPVIVVTAFAGEKDSQMMLESGCNDYLTKPVTGNTLRQKIREMLTR